MSGIINEEVMGRLIRNFRLGYEKAGLVIYIIPRDDAGQLMVRGEDVSNGDVTLYGTKVMIHVPCGGRIYGRYLSQIGEDLFGTYLLMTNGKCRVRVTWEEQGIDAHFDLRPNEALLIMVRLMRFRRRRAKPSSEALRIMRVLGVEGELLYSDVNGEVQIFGVTRGFEKPTPGGCVNEVVLNNWKFTFNACSQVVSFPANNANVLMIYGADTIAVSRYYPALGVWYELGRVNGPGRYIIVLKG
ncbi:MAG: hypothetical protein L7H05_00705 [Vulcanisaeta sp.]|nr:hypothetical protein [Vulcanisaeta sp.]